VATLVKNGFNRYGSEESLVPGLGLGLGLGSGLGLGLGLGFGR